jgi:hypothetical protein
MKIKNALEFLNTLIANGAEFPDAVTKTCAKYNISSTVLTKEYDLHD